MEHQKWLRSKWEEQNVDVEQMDAVVTGLIGGGTASLLIVVGGAVALWSDLYKSFTTPAMIFMWLSILSALAVGQLYLTYQVVSAFSVTPTQTEKAIVS